ncbi:MAG TPA: Calx-beta domain-containing protein [Xenococcaceae cyanobacterium]
MATINFNQIGSFNGTQGGPKVLNNPTSIQFGPDGRLYVAEQNGSINAFTVTLQDGEYIATDHETLLLPNGSEVVKSLQNHNDDGSPGIDINNGSPVTNRQVTGLVTTGTATNPVLYVSSSDPRIATNGEVQLDTNSGVVTQLTWTGTEWEAVDIIRGLPRSEENHSVNGMVLSADGTKLYLTVGGNTNNGAPSQFFSYTGEYALSGTVLEIDLTDIESRSILTDPAGGQNGTPRQYIYDLPTLDDPTVPNNGDRENSSGLDVDGPWGGNDGFNMAILPADAPIRIYADGLRNQYDIVLTESGKLYTVDNGSNSNLGGNPIDANGNPTDQAGAGEATNTPNNGGTGDPEPLFLLEDGGYYGHPAPARANQDLPWIVYGDNGNPDPALSPNAVPNLSSLVPDAVNIQNGFIIDPSKFTGNAARLSQSGIRIKRTSSESNTLVNLGSSSNGLAEYTGDAFDGALKGALLVTQFNGNVTLLNLSQDGTTIEPLIDPGNDGILGTADDETIDSDGVFPLITGQSQPLDVTIGPDGTIWVAEFGPDNINIFAPSDIILPDDPDFDDDAILNVDDPFIRDATNGGSVLILPGQTFLWDFDANQDDNLPGPGGYGGGLTGVMIDGVIDFEEFFQEPSTLPEQIIKLDNVKFTTAAGGGTTVIESVSNGNPLTTGNNGEYLFHTGVTIAPTVDTFTIKWTVFNPATLLSGPSQQLGGYIGTGDQSNYLKIVAVENSNGEIQVLLEDNDVVQASSFIQADGLFEVPDNQKIFFELEIDPTAATATPLITYQTGGGNTTTVSGTAIDLSNTAVLDAILGDYTVQGQTTGLAVGLFSSNIGQPEANTFQAIFDDIEITATGDDSATVLYRVNAGGPQIAALDGGPAWSADTGSNNSPFLVVPGSNNTATFPAVEPGATVPAFVPGAIFDTERWDNPAVPEMAWAFDVPTAGLYEVRLFLGNGFNGTQAPGDRVFDVALEGNVPSNLSNIDLSAQFGHQVGGMITNTVNVTDGTLNIEFLHDIGNNPLVNGIEIVQLGEGMSLMPMVSIVGDSYTASEADPLVQISLLTDVTVPNDETVNVTFEIVPGTATPQSDYQYQSATATFDQQTGVYTDTVTIAGGSSDATFLVDILQDTIPESDEAFTVNIVDVSNNAQIGNDSASVTIEDDDSTNPTDTGEAVLGITLNSNNVQISNFGNNSFEITNTGTKKITQVSLDVTNALYPDTVFDPFGLAGDTVSKPLSINTNGGTGIIAPSNASYIGTGGTAGFEAIQLSFDENVNGGFESGETIGFSIDMDPNSVAGTQKNPLDAGSNPPWDVGGVSGAELIGSTFTVTFTDGTTATGQLQGAGNQAGSQAIASQSSPNLPVSLIVNGLSAGGIGTYDENGASVIVNGSAGQTARVVLTKGFIQPVIPYATFLENQLNSLAASDFPANNAVEFQTVDVLLTGENQDISEQFDLSGVADFNFEGEDKLPLGFVASIIDPTNNNLPLGSVTQPIYLQFDEQNPGQNEVSITATQNAAEPDVDGQFTVSLSEIAATDTTVTYLTTGTATSSSDYTALSGEVTIPAGSLNAPIDVAVLDDQDLEGSEDVIVTLNAITAGDANIELGTSTTATVTIADDEDINGTVINGTEGKDTLEGTNEAEIINGLGDRDVLRGNGGNDTLNGNQGNDRLNGGIDDDVLNGDSGNDLLIGARGNDTVTGGAGNDRFRLIRTNDGTDEITDFDPSEDTLEFKGSNFSDALVKGVLPNSQFVSGTTAVDSDDYFIYDQNTGNLFFDADGVDGDEQVLMATLSNQANLSADDIVIV